MILELRALFDIFSSLVLFSDKMICVLINTMQYCTDSLHLRIFLELP